MVNPDTAAVKAYLLGLQARIVGALESLDGTPFRTDSWVRPEGGGGISRPDVLATNGKLHDIVLGKLRT